MPLAGFADARCRNTIASLSDTVNSIEFEVPSQLNITRLLSALLAVCASLAAQAAEIVRVGFPESIPPWVRGDNRPGIAVELLTEALRSP